MKHKSTSNDEDMSWKKKEEIKTKGEGLLEAHQMIVI